MALWWDSSFFHLKSFGQRLLRRNPNDYDVKFWMIRALNPHTSEEDRTLIVRYAQELVKAKPDRPGSYSSLGFAYKELFFADKSLSAGDKALKAYRQYYAMIPATATTQKNQHYVTSLIQRMQTKWKKDGTARP
jgi:hypothetical protein